MARNLRAAAAVLLLALVLNAALHAADARRGSHGHFRKGGHHFAIHHVRHARIAAHRRHFRIHRFHRRHFMAARHHDGQNRCAWLRHRALITGSRYWWRRYWRCRYGYRFYAIGAAGPNPCVGRSASSPWMRNPVYSPCLCRPVGCVALRG